MKPGWRRLLQVNPSCSSFVCLGLKMWRADTRQRQRQRHEARRTADGTDMGSRSGLLHLICRTSAPKDQTGPPGQSWSLTRTRTRSVYLTLNTMSVSGPAMSACGEGEAEGRRQGSSTSDEGQPANVAAAGRVVPKSTQIGCDQSEPWPKGTLTGTGCGCACG